MLVPNRQGSTPAYRYGFNGMEKDDELKGPGESYTTEFRQYDPRIGRWLSLDPLMAKYPNMSPFIGYNNNPIFFVDPKGLEGEPPMNLDPRHLLSAKNFRAKEINSMIVNVNWQEKSVLESFYKEAVGLVKQMGKVEKDVRLSNGSVWNVNVKTGHFYPVSSVDGSIVNLSKAEMYILQGATKNGAKGDKIFANIVKALEGRGMTGTLSESMQSALSSLSKIEGVSSGNALKEIAKYLPSTPMPAEATNAAKSRFGATAKFVKWGGRALLVVAIASDIYEVYNSQSKARTITKKVGGWTGASLGAAGTAIGLSWFEAAPGPGTIAHGVATLGGGIAGYFIGETVTETVYDWVFKREK